jgi:GrpB-like predicted nucleotidyltransferase (UPF0157 family)
MKFRPEEEIRESVGAVFAEHRVAIEKLLPEAEVEHVGATAVPGAWTKGDLDLLVRVPDQHFDSAVTALQRRYAIHQPENWTPKFASFKQEPEGEIPVGVQLVIAGSKDDRLFIAWREQLIAEPHLLNRYNAFKRDQSGADPDQYIEAKAAFIEATIGEGGGTDQTSHR